MRPWVLGAWIFLTLGITAGSYWAYYELGWGGWWFWDPVENASLMPWLAATALLHSLNVLAARDSLRAWTVMLAMIGFSMSMVGTFLVRSGILTSVHSFAVDPSRGTFLLMLLGLYVGAALTLFALRSPKLAEGAAFELVSREAALVGNNLLLSVILGIVFIGTLYPLFVEAVTGEKLSVGAPYFNAVAGPIALVLAALIGVGPLLNWRSDCGERLKRLVIPALIGVTVLAVLHASSCDGGLLEKLALAVAAMLLVASLLPLVGRKLRRTPLVDLGDGGRPFRGRGGDRSEWREAACGPARRWSRRRSARRSASGRGGPVRIGDADRRAQLDRARGRAVARRGAAGQHPQAAGALLFRPADRDDGIGDQDGGVGPALHGARQAGGGRPLAAAACGGSRW